MRRPIALCALLAVSLGAAACGDGGDDPGAAAVESAALVDDRTVDETIADFNIADAAVIELTDLPPGWKGTVSDEDPAADEALLTCANPPNRAVVENERAVAEREYELGDSNLYSSVAVYPNDAYSDEAFDLVRMDAYPECFRSVLETEVQRDLTASGAPVDVQAQVQRFPDPAMGDEAAALRLDVLLTGPGGQRLMVIDLIGVRIGRAQTVITLIGSGGPFDPAEADRLIRLSTDRLSAAT
jgi:hypothetical protein